MSMASAHRKGSFLLGQRMEYQRTADAKKTAGESAGSSEKSLNTVARHRSNSISSCQKWWNIRTKAKHSLELYLSIATLVVLLPALIFSSLYTRQLEQRIFTLEDQFARLRLQQEKEAKHAIGKEDIKVLVFQYLMQVSIKHKDCHSFRFGQRSNFESVFYILIEWKCLSM